MGVVAMAAMLGITSAAPTVDFDSRSFILDGKPDLLLSGVVHYARVLPADWNRTFSLMTEMGLNTVQVNHSLTASRSLFGCRIFVACTFVPGTSLTHDNRYSLSSPSFSPMRIHCGAPPPSHRRM